jgi:xanthine dehydrogenase accessory factor
VTVWGRIAAELAAGRAAVLVAVTATQGSAPREAGARLVLTEAGFTGTVGGGALEWRALAEAGTMLAHRRRTARRLDLALGPDTGQCCGGRVVLGLELFEPADAAEVADLAAAEADGPFSVHARLDGDRWRRDRLDSPATGDAVAERGLSERLETYGERPRRLVLFGAGHVGRALVLALAPLPFRTLWVDERADAFPAAVPANVACRATADPISVVAELQPGDFVLAMTHSHQLDLALVDAALKRDDLPYVGVIGSKTKRARFLSRLTAAGHPTTVRDRLVCPIGAGGPASRLPAVIAAATVVELLVADERARAAAGGDLETMSQPKETRR